MRPSEIRALRLATALLSAATRLLPPGFRRQWGGAVVETFRDEARELLDVAGPALVWRLWLDAALDLIGVAAREWRDAFARTRAARAAAGRGAAVESLLEDVRYSLHGLRRNPGFALAAVLTLALGIGLNTAQFSITSSLLFRPLPVPEPDRLALVFASGREPGFGRFSFADYRDFEASADAFESLSASLITGATLRTGHDARTLFGQAVTANYFRTFGIASARGRLFGVEVEKDPQSADVVVLSYRAWKSRFGGDPAVIGRGVTLNGQAFTVVGVAPEGFRGCYNFWFAPEFWVPVASLRGLDPEQARHLDERGRSFAHVVGRLKDGVSHAEAGAQLAAIAERLAREYPGTNRDRRAHVFRELDTRPEVDTAGLSRVAMAVFQALAGLVLLVACANVSNLLLARAAGRRREVAVRLAIGASRRRLVRQFLTEGLVLSAISATLGLGLAVVLVRRLSGFTMPTYFPLALDLVVDGRSLLFAVAAATFTALAFALVPALQASRPDLVPALKGEAAGRGGRRSRLSGSLVAAQVAVSLVLLVAGGLFLRSMRAADRVDLGYETDHTLLATLNLDQPGYDVARRHRLVLDLARRVGALPGVVGVTEAAPVPMEFSADGGLVYVEGRELSRDDDAGERMMWTWVGPAYFEVVGTPIVRGRGFDAGDDDASRRVAVVNETLAERFWPGLDPVGRVLRFEDPASEPVVVVGVAKNAVYRAIAEPEMPYVYRPLLQDEAEGPTLVVRTVGEPGSVAPAVRAALRDLDPGVPLLEVKTYDDLIEGRALLAFRMGAGLGGAVGLMALGLAMLGLYGVVALSVNRRTREIGIRMALGAERGRVVGLVVRQGLGLVTIGVALGLVGALAAGQVLSGLLIGVEGSDPPTLAAVAGLLVAVGAVASWLPARRASRVDPQTALRSE